MGYATTAVLAITALCLVFGLALGFLRGFNRSVLRACLVVVSLLIAIALRSTFTSIIMGLDMGGESLADTLAASFSDGSIPASLQDLVLVLVEIIIGLAGFFVCFLALLLITWLIFFPILKIFVKKGNKKRRLLGAVVGLAQGFVIAFAFCAPLTGLFVQMDKLAQIELQGQTVIEIPQELGLADYVESAPCGFYDATGSWFFDMLSSGKTADGKNISIDDATEIVKTVGEIANATTELESSLGIMTEETATPQQRVDAMKDLANVLTSIDSSISNLSGDAKEVVNEVVSSVKDMIAEEGEPLDPAIEEIFDNFDIDSLDLGSAGQAIGGIATYIEKTSDEFSNNEPVSQQDIDNIVNGIAGCDLVFSMITDGEETPTLIAIEDAGHKAMFENAIESNTTLSAQDTQALLNLFGINA